MTLLIDNYDSFSYNLYQLVGSIDPEITVIRNDAMTVSEIEALRPDRIILSPVPGTAGDDPRGPISFPRRGPGHRAGRSPGHRPHRRR